MNPSEQPASAQGAETQEQVARRIERLNAIGTELLKTRKDAIDARLNSGIETIWTEDQEHYESIDDETRNTSSDWQAKPPGQSSGRKAAGNTSIVFPNITRPYVDAAASKVGDILLPTDDRPWSLEPTPVPDLIDKSHGKLPPEVTQGMQQNGIPPETQQKVVAQEVAAALKVMADAKAKAEKAEKRIEDWMVEGQWHAEVRKVIDDCVRIGSGVLKGPIPVAKRAQMFKEGVLMIEEKIQPASKRISPWNFFPDGGCGETVHNGAFTWERDYITPKQLEMMKAEPGYIASQIDLCIEEGPTKATEVRKTADGKSITDKSLFEIWYFHGQVKPEDLEAAGCKCEDGAESVPAVFTMVNDRVIKGILNPLDTGDFPYDVIPWQRMANMPWGTGVGRHIRTPQQMVTAGVRTWSTNAGRSAGPVFVVKNGVITPADGVWDITPWKVFYAGEDDTTDDVNKAMAMFEIPDRRESMQAYINFALKLAEDVTGLPMLLQGQQGGAPETLGGQQLVERNASGTLRRIARTFDDCITEPHVRRYYAWLLQYGEDEEKGEFVIDARGSTALVERDLEKQQIGEVLKASLNPAFGLDPELCMEEYLRVNKRDPKNFQLSEEKKQQLSAKKPPSDPRIDVATIKAEADAKIKAAEQQFEEKQNDLNRKNEIIIAMIDQHIANEATSAAERTALMSVKGNLAKTVMELNTEKDLALAGHKVAIHKHRTPPPKFEPAGKAPDGQAFSR
jgi:hypothetical protein